MPKLNTPRKIDRYTYRISAREYMAHITENENFDFATVKEGHEFITEDHGLFVSALADLAGKHPTFASDINKGLHQYDVLTPDALMFCDRRVVNGPVTVRVQRYTDDLTYTRMKTEYETDSNWTRI